MNVTPYQQEHSHTCAVACLRMVADYFGVIHTEAELLPLCGTTPDGTTPDGIAYAARKLGFRATITYDEPVILTEALNRQQPVIVFVGIPLAQTPLSLEIHAVVVIGINDSTVTFLDPLDGAQHHQSKSDFYAMWDNAFHAAILIEKI